MKQLFLTLLLFFSTFASLQIEARRGSGAGWFFGGLATGAILSSAARRSDYASDEAYIRALLDENAALRDEIQDLQRELRKAEA